METKDEREILTKAITELCEDVTLEDLDLIYRILLAMAAEA